MINRREDGNEDKSTEISKEKKSQQLQYQGHITGRVVNIYWINIYSYSILFFFQDGKLEISNLFSQKLNKTTLAPNKLQPDEYKFI